MKGLFLDYDNNFIRRMLQIPLQIKFTYKTYVYILIDITNAEEAVVIFT